VTIYHWSHPLWLGRDLWLDWSRVRELFGAYVEFAATEINRRLVARGQPPIGYYITMNEPISYPLAAHALGVFPIGEKRGLTAALRCYENEIMAHVLAYRTIHRIHRENGWPRPTVTFNTWCSAAYSFDKLTQDLVLARRNGVAQADVPRFVADQRARFNDRMKAVPYRRGPRVIKRALDVGIDAIFWRRLKHAPMPALTEMLYAGPEERPLDVLGFDIYDPFWGNNLDFGGPRLARARVRPDEWGINPAALEAAIECYSWTAGDLPIHLLENGMSYRFADGRVRPHPDGLHRDEALQDVFLACLRAMRDGRRLRSYYYWSLTDNYEWGSFGPRFGLFGVDYADGARRLPTDIAGHNAAGAYRLLTEAFQSRDKQALKAALLRRDYPRISEAGA
jgi:beta-glucosidase/6-phospho-beta-glucosidase/beta-galactosidase